MQKAPGKTYLQVTGILLLVGSAISIIGSLLIILGGGVAASGVLNEAMAQSGMDAATATAGGAALVGTGILTLLVGVFQLIVGIIGVKNCNVLEKGALCMKLGMALLVLSALSSLITLISSFSVSGIFALLAGLVLPALYFFGGKKNKEAAQTPVQ